MTLTRESYVAICQTCINRKFDPKKGIICGITAEYANFEISCPDFTEDPIAVKYKKREEEKNALKQDFPEVNLHRQPGRIEGFIGGNILGIILIVAAIGLLVFTNEVSATWDMIFICIAVFLGYAGAIAIGHAFGQWELTKRPKKEDEKSDREMR